MTRSAGSYEPTPGKANIFIVEDEGLIARDIERRLLKAGYSVSGIVDSGGAALEQIAELGADLVLMDIRLRGDMDGIDTAQHLHQRHDLPVIFLTAHTDRETLDRAKVTSPFGYLAKPLSSATLATSVEIALSKHRAERQLRQQRAWLRTALESMVDGVIVGDQQGRVQYMNPSAEKLTGWLLNDALNQPISQVLKLFCPDSDHQFTDALFAGLQNEKHTPFPVGTRLATRTNGQVTVDGDIAPSLEKGASLGAVITFRDTTIREEREREHRQEQKMLAVGRLAAGIAHDFNNLLTVVLGHADLLLGRNDWTAKTARRAVEEIRKAGTTAAALTRQLLTFSRHQNTEASDVDLNQLVRQSEDLCKSLLGETVAWKVRLRPDLRKVRGDPSRFSQILMNLVVNGRDAMAAGGVLTVTTDNVRTPAKAVPGAEPGTDYVVLGVTDTGVGMDAAVADHIFEPFFTTKPVGQGSGLGLSVVHAIVKDLGGRISVRSAPGEGSRFEVFLPVAEQTISPPPVPLTDSPPGVATGFGTILLVDDNEGVRKLMAVCLVASGYQILQAADGQQALSLAAGHNGPIDLLLTDVVMPVMNGICLAEQLSRLRPDMKVLFVSGYADGAYAKECVLPPDARLLQKPFEPGDLLEHVNRLIQNRPRGPAA